MDMPREALLELCAQRNRPILRLAQLIGNRVVEHIEMPNGERRKAELPVKRDAVWRTRRVA